MCRGKPISCLPGVNSSKQLALTRPPIEDASYEHRSEIAPHYLNSSSHGHSKRSLHPFPFAVVSYMSNINSSWFRV